MATTVTGLTADRMLAIEAASVVDGDVDGSGNLILTKHDGTKINAGSVIGPQGPQGPVGSDLSVLAARAILDVGIVNQIRAGRQLSPADFGNLGLSAPIGLWNLSDLTDASGNGRALLNKGAVPFTSGINGGANTAAQFVGSAAQALYISDTGANDPFRIKTGSVGCWFRVAKTGTVQCPLAKSGSAGGNYGWWIQITANNTVQMAVSYDGSATPAAVGFSNVVDDHWHFVVGTIDGTIIRVYVDGVLEGYSLNSGLLFGTSGPVNVGGFIGDASTATLQPFFGRVDEAFVTSDVLTDDQVRNLYCAKIPHTLAAVPSRLSLNVRRRRKGAAFVSADFSTQPLRLHNFSAGSVVDEGSNNVPLTSGRTGTNLAAGSDGSSNNSYYFNGNAGTDFASTDTGLPFGANPRSYGLWIKTTNASSTVFGALSFGLNGSHTLMYVNNGGIYDQILPGGANIGGTFIADGRWHFVVAVADNNALDGVKHKLYMDGVLIATEIIWSTTVAGGANSFRVGSHVNGSSPFLGNLDGAFVCGYALTSEQICSLYAKGSQALTPSPKNVGDHVEAMDANNLLAIFDTLESQHQVDLKVAA